MGRHSEVIIEKKKMHIEQVLVKAENNHLYNIQTEGNSFGYIYDDGWIAVVMPQGRIQMRLDRALKFGKDLAEICSEIADLVERRILE